MMSPRTAVLLAHAVAGVELALVVVGWLLAWKRPQDPAHLPLLSSTPGVPLIVFGALASALIGGIASLSVRYRRAGDVQRAQVRWVAWAIAALRYRLYDIDRIISRTAAYALVTVVTMSVYAIVVTSASALFPALPSVAVAVATLVAAAIFLPLLRWVRAVVDRRFDRARYDAQRIVDAFGERMRTGSDPGAAQGELAAAVDDALRPSSLGMWVVTATTRRTVATKDRGGDRMRT
jgi:hypothetical protein